jgi:hypothetical protein
VRSLQRAGRTARARLAISDLTVSRREMLAGGIGAVALVALPDLSLAGRPAARSSAAASAGGSRYVLLYGTPESAPAPGGSISAAMSPVSRTTSLPAAKPVATTLAAAPGWPPALPC